MSTLVILEAGHRLSEEAIAAAQSLGSASAAIAGDATAAASKQLEKVHSVQHTLLAQYTADAYTAGLAPESRLQTHWELLSHLKSAGRTEADRWLDSALEGSATFRLGLWPSNRISRAA